jgi:hypothetical protein
MAATDSTPQLRVVEEAAGRTPVGVLPGRAPRSVDRATARPGTTARPGASARSGPDRISVILFSLAAVLVVLTLLARQLNAASATVAPRRQIVVRRIYQTTIVEKAPGQGAGTSVSQSVSSSGSGYSPAAAPTTRSSSAP